MDRVKLLIEKYGLPDELARRVVRDFKGVAISTPEADLAIRPTSNPDTNKAVIEKLASAEPDLYRPAQSTVGFKFHVQQIDFKIDGQTYRIDDLALIEQIRQLIDKADLKYTPKYKKLRSQRPYIRDIAKYLLDYSAEPTEYKKRVFVGRIISEFNSDFDIDFEPSLTNHLIQNKVKNLLKT